MQGTRSVVLQANGTASSGLLSNDWAVDMSQLSTLVAVQIGNALQCFFLVLQVANEANLKVGNFFYTNHQL